MGNVGTLGKVGDASSIFNLIAPGTVGEVHDVLGPGRTRGTGVKGDDNGEVVAGKSR